MRLEDLPLAMSIEEAAEALGVRRSAMYQTVRQGHIRSIRVGRKIRIPRVALAEFLDGIEPEESDDGPSAQEIEGS